MYKWKIKQQAVSTYLVKMGNGGGGSDDKKPTYGPGVKRNMRILFSQLYYIVKYLLGTLYTKTDKASREMKNSSSKWILNKTMFQKLIQVDAN